jgi:hypothetical protein
MANESSEMPESPLAAPTLQVPRVSQKHKRSRFWKRFVTTRIVLLGRDERIIGSVLPLPFGKCVKYGRTVQLSEAAALQFVAEKISIPIPQVYCAFERKNIKYIVTERIKGEEIGKGWADQPEPEQTKLLKELDGCFGEFRKIPHPRPGAIASAELQSLWDPRKFKGELGFGPFANEKDFNRYLTKVLGGDVEILKDANSWVTEEEKAEMRKLLAM